MTPLGLASAVAWLQPGVASAAGLLCRWEYMPRPRLTIGRRLALLGSIGLVVALLSNGAG